MKQPAVTIRCLRPCPYVKASNTFNWWFLWTIIFLSSCSVKVNTFYDQTAAFETYQTYVYLRGSLIIDIADANESKMVWRSDAVEYLDISTDITNSRLKRAVKKTLKKFPPGD